jgi:hypothetical protein
MLAFSAKNSSAPADVVKARQTSDTGALMSFSTQTIRPEDVDAFLGRCVFCAADGNAASATTIARTMGITDCKSLIEFSFSGPTFDRLGTGQFSLQILTNS